MTAASAENRRMHHGPIARSASATPMHTAVPIHSAARLPWRTRSGLPAPMFCPTKVVTAMEKLCTGRKAMVSTLFAAL